MQKNINFDQLLSFVKKVYSDACFGHLDLLESYAQKECRKFFDTLKNANPIVIDTSNYSNNQIENITISNSQQVFSYDEIYRNNITITNNTSDFI